MARKALGRGLSALLGEETALVAERTRETDEIDIDLIRPNPQQPRTRFPDNTLDELAQSITSNGIVQPIVVRRKGDLYEIVAGERRWRAAQRAGLRKIPAAVREVSDDKLLELALIENIQRQELNPIEEARAFRKLIDNIGLTQEQAAERVGKERSLIATSMRLLKLPDDIQKLIEEERLNAGHGRALLMAEDPTVQRRVARSIIEGGLSVREAEREVKKASRHTGKASDNKRVRILKDANMLAAETKLRRRYGTNVLIHPSQTNKGGKIEIEYYSGDDLSRLYDILMGNTEEKGGE